MNIIIDSNVLFSALIKDSTTRRTILEYDGIFLFPAYIFDEMQEHKTELLEKTGLSEEDFNKLLNLILKKVAVVPNEKLTPFREEAKGILNDIDLDDVLFIACALAYPDSIIWSDDKRLKKQTKVKVLNTEEAIEFLKNKWEN